MAKFSVRKGMRPEKVRHSTISGKKVGGVDERSSMLRAHPGKTPWKI